MTLDDFLATLSSDARARFDALVADGSHEARPFDAVRRFARERLADLRPGAGGRELDREAGVLRGEVHRRFGRPGARRTTGVLAVLTQPVMRALPYPLGLRARSLREDAARRARGEDAPQFAFDLIATNGLLLRLVAAIAIQSYVRVLDAPDVTLNQSLVRDLRAPADGTWLTLAHALSRAVAGRARAGLAAEIAATFDRRMDVGDGRTEAVVSALQGMVSFRNRLVHGGRVAADEVSRYFDRFERILTAFGFLAEWEFIVLTGAGALRLSGDLPEPCDAPSDLPPGEPILVHRAAGRPNLSLHPLVHFNLATDNPGLAVDDLFFFNGGALERQRYVAYRVDVTPDGHALGTYEAYRAFMGRIACPELPADPRIDWNPLADEHRVHFVGREDALDACEAFVRERPCPVGVLKAEAGMGKTALIARLFERHAPRRRPQRAEDRWYFHFCMPIGGRDSAVVALRSLIAHLCDDLGLPHGEWLSHDETRLREELFPAVLELARRSLASGARIVVVIDALDEGIADDQRGVPGVIPPSPPDDVVFLASYRVDAAGANPRVEQRLMHLAPGSCMTIPGADPLPGLSRWDVRRYLDRLSEATPDATLDRIWTAATRDCAVGADPFYLRFLASGVDAGVVDLGRAETVPETIDEAFEDAWLALPTDRDFLLHRVLCALAVMWDYGDDALFAELFRREPIPGYAELKAVDVAAVRTRAGKLLTYNEDRYGLFHERFKRFLVGEGWDADVTMLERG